jgi:hypothetical protein
MAAFAAMAAFAGMAERRPAKPALERPHRRRPEVPPAKAGGPPGEGRG